MSALVPAPVIVVTCGTDRAAAIRAIMETIDGVRRLQCRAEIAVVLDAALSTEDEQILEYMVMRMINDAYYRVTATIHGGKLSRSVPSVHSVDPSCVTQHGVLVDIVFHLMQRELDSRRVLHLSALCRQIADLVPHIPHGELDADVHSLLVYFDACHMIKYIATLRVVVPSTDAFADIVRKSDAAFTVTALGAIEDAQEYISCVVGALTELGL